MGWDGGPTFSQPQLTPSSVFQPPPLHGQGPGGMCSVPCLAERTTPRGSKLSHFPSFSWGCPRLPDRELGKRPPQDGWISMRWVLVTPASEWGLPASDENGLGGCL